MSLPIALHKVGNKANTEGYFLSDGLLQIDDTLSELLNGYFISSFKFDTIYEFFHESNLDLNEVYTYSSAILEDPASLLEQSRSMAKYLYECSDHPKIKAGELYVVYYEAFDFKGGQYPAVGIFKSEQKDIFLKVKPFDNNFEIDQHEGVNLAKLDKGAIVILDEEGNTKPRRGGDGAPLGFFGRLRATSLSLVIFLVGVLACTYVLYQLYDIYFITHADSAQVAVPGQQVSLPREGAVQALVKVGDTVAKGAPVGTFSSNMMDVLKGVLPTEDLTPDNLQRLFGKTFQGTLTSPCDCRVTAQLIGDGQTAAKGAPVFLLSPVDAVATVEARFPYRAFDELQPGTAVSFTVAGEGGERSGHITTLALQDGGLASDIRVMIQPSEPLQTELAKRPVDVRIRPLGGIFDQRLAAEGQMLASKLLPGDEAATAK